MDIKKYLREKNVSFHVGTHVPQYTSQNVAAAEHIGGWELAKVVIVKADGKPMMTVLQAPKQVDLDRLAAVLSAERVELAEEYELDELFPDCETGAEPPFGNLYNMPVLVDRELTTKPYIVFQSGSHREAVRISYSDYERIVKPRVADFAVKAEAMRR